MAQVIDAVEESFHEIEVTTSELDSNNNQDLLCSSCGKRFYTKWGLKRHETGHNKAHKLVCSVCNATFATRGHYEGHVNVHHDARPHVCQHCNARYAYRSALLRHIAICSKPPSSHASTLEYKCDNCGQIFTRKDNLKDHVLGKHTGLFRYVCPSCKKEFRWRSTLRRHVKSCKMPDTQ